MRLIDLNKIPHKAFRGDRDDLVDALFAAPTVDAVPVVRCGECKWWKTNYLWNGTERKVCVIEPYEPCRKSDDYCSRGERKGGDE